MCAILPLLEISGHGQTDLVIVATVLFLVFATCGLIVSSSGQSSLEAEPAAETQPPLAARPWRSPWRAVIIAGLLCGLVVLAISGY
jgi:hypothetical protein